MNYVGGYCVVLDLTGGNLGAEGKESRKMMVENKIGLGCSDFSNTSLVLRYLLVSFSTAE